MLSDTLDYCCLSSSIMDYGVFPSVIASRFGTVKEIQTCVCLPSSCLSSIMIMYPEWWIMNHQSYIRLDCKRRRCVTVSLVARWRTGAFSRWGILRPALRKKGIHKLIASWSSFIAHRTTDNACVCQSCDSRTVLSLRLSLSWSWTTQLQDLHP